MKIKKLLLLTSVAFIASGCNLNANNANNQVEPGASSESGSSHSGSSSSSSSSSSSGGGSTKINVAAHTLTDGAAPIDLDSNCQRISESTWNAFKNGTSSMINDHYNYTYRATVNRSEILYEQYTKNGYYFRSTSGQMYYEKKSGSSSSYYQYRSVSDGWIREDAAIAVQNKFSDRLKSECDLHMGIDIAYNEFEFNEYMGFTYTGPGNSPVINVRFQGGYLTFLSYSLDNGDIYYTINTVFETEISIPKSYYYN